ncbi:MAG: hypothetical protein H6825_11000 [Planctomycetes bacterium]|nr:hypothetical protein [Planctomycetota bacterium]
MRPLPILSALLGAVLLAGCHGLPLTIPTEPVGPGEEVIGPVDGSATGLMILQFIPVGQNQRFQRAYDAALQKVGATRLVDVTIREDWFWAYILNGYTTHVSGTAVRGQREDDRDIWGARDMR